jgi:peptidyl-prolyl cis-trans isomerase SurA
MPHRSSTIVGIMQNLLRPAAWLAVIATLCAPCASAALAADKAVKPAAAAPKAAAPKTDAAKPDTTKSDPGATVYVVVNDIPITSFTIDQRIKLLSLDGGGWQQRLQAMLHAPNINDKFRAFATARNPKSQQEVIALQRQFVEGLRQQAMAQSRPGLKDSAISQLIAESLQHSEAKRMNLLASDDELNGAIGDLAKRNKKTLKEFEAQIGSSGISVRAFRERIRTQMSWQRVLGQKFRGQIVVGRAEIDQALASSVGNVGGAAASVELKLQRITIPLKSTDAATSVAGYATADKLREQAKPCNNLAQLAKQSPGAKFEDLGSVRPETLSAEARPILASAEAGSVPPPILTRAGIEIYGVCERTSGTQGEGAKAAVRNRIEQQKFEAMSKGVLSDLCASASIEARNGFQLKKSCGLE